MKKGSSVKIMADIGIAAGQVAAGAMVLPFVIPELDEARLPVIALGVALSGACWIGSILLARKVKS